MPPIGLLQGYEIGPCVTSPVIYARAVRNLEGAQNISNETKADILAPWRKAKR